jgi:hypothetical protein
VEGVLSAVSSQTEALFLSYVEGGSRLRFYRQGVLIEGFEEPGSRPYGTGPFHFYQHVGTDVDPTSTVLSAAESYIGVDFTEEQILGELATVSLFKHEYLGIPANRQRMDTRPKAHRSINELGPKISDLGGRPTGMGPS